MSSKSSNIQPSPNNWFSLNVEYVGQGRAEFSDPMLTVEGPVKVWIDEFGNQRIEMNVEKFNANSSYGEPNRPEMQIPLLMALLYGEKPIRMPLAGPTTRAVKMRYEITGKRINPCTKLIIETLEGIFSVAEIIPYNISFELSDIRESQVTLKFSPVRSQFDMNDAGIPKYWVLPLSNYISDFRDNHLDLNRHPLRIFRTPIIPDNLPEKDAMIARFEANQNNFLTLFNFNHSLGFIEKLPNYEERKKELLEGRKRSIITAVMVGEVCSNNTDFVDLVKWFPFDFLNLLSIATGSKVGAPWIEFRNYQGKLVRRIHIYLNRPLCFSEGHVAISEIHHHGTGKLLNGYLNSKQKNHSYLTSILKHLVSVESNQFSIEDKMDHLFRAFDSLCEINGLSRQDLTKSLDEKQKNFINGILSSAAERIRSEAKVACISDHKNVLIKIADRVKNANNTDRAFGLAVIDLLELFNLPDATIVDAHYQVNPRKDGMRWHQVLSYYRTAVIHDGHFDFKSGKYDFYDAYRICQHLHDILIRIVLKMLYYDGTYQRAVAVPGWAGPYSLDWVKPNTPASELGY